MSYDISSKLKIAVTTRALFNLENEHALYEEEGRDEYEAYQIQNENNILEHGTAFSVVKALLSINKIEKTKNQVEVIVVTRNNANTGIRVFNSIDHYNLPITRGCFTGGSGLTPYLKALDIDLFLTANEQDAQEAIDAGIPAAVLLTQNNSLYKDSEENKIRIAFDGDAVIFFEESELIYKKQGMDSFKKNEIEHANEPMKEGPFVKFLKMISNLQKALGEDQTILRTALITARNAPSHTRVINTLRKWNIRIDEIFFLGGLSKTPILEAFGAQIFFDDQKVYTDSASKKVPSGTVPYNSQSELNKYKN